MVKIDCWLDNEVREFCKNEYITLEAYEMDYIEIKRYDDWPTGDKTVILDTRRKKAWNKYFSMSPGGTSKGIDEIPYEKGLELFNGKSRVYYGLT